LVIDNWSLIIDISALSPLRG